MALTSFDSVLSYLRRFRPDHSAGQQDEQLLARFLQGEQSAFNALLGRYAPLVWGVCRRALGPSPDAEDAFQATFVVLVQKADSLRGGPIGPWLHRVASRTAGKAKLRRARIASRESDTDVEPAVSDPDEMTWREICGVLDEELSRLPERYRQPIVLCYLEGLTNEEAAQRLACPRGTILSRLARARDQLRDRLRRRGIDMPQTLLPALAARESAPPAVIEALVNAVPLLRAGGETALSASVMNLAKGVMFSMLARKLELIGLAMLMVALAASGAGWFNRRSEAGPKDTPPAKKAAAKKAERPAEKAPEKKDDQTAGKRGQNPAVEVLNTRIERYGGLDDPRTTLAEALDQLAKGQLSKLPSGRDVVFDINEKAFKDEKLKKVLRTEVANPNPVPPMDNVAIATILKRILAKVPVESGATFLIRKDAIEITTKAAARAELRLPANKEIILVHQDFHKVPLTKALDDIAESLGVNIVVDPRVTEKAKVEVTARLTNVHLEAAVRVLADMGGLDVVPLGNVLYVTTPENATKWDKTRRAACGDTEPTPSTPAKKTK